MSPFADVRFRLPSRLVTIIRSGPPVAQGIESTRLGARGLRVPDSLRAGLRTRSVVRGSQWGGVASTVWVARARHDRPIARSLPGARAAINGLLGRLSLVGTDDAELVKGRARQALDGACELRLWRTGSSAQEPRCRHRRPNGQSDGFITSLGGSAAVLGLIEGIADGLAGVARLGGGALADDPARRRATAVGGYTSVAVLSGLIGAAASLWQVVALRTAAWTARGLRVPSRTRCLPTRRRARPTGAPTGSKG